MSLPAQDYEQIYLLPGEIAIVDQPVEIKTILGSCVGIVMYDEFSCRSGMIHYLLPRTYSNEDASGRYADYAIKTLFESLLSLGASRIQAKIYGGASVLDSVKIGDGVGKENIEIGFHTLKHLNIPIVEQNTGGFKTRKITFRSDSHEVIHEFTIKR